MFYPFLNYFNRGRVRTVDNYGIPVLRTNYVTTDTTTTSVTYGVCPRLWRQLPCQGLFILHVTSTPASAATPTDLVFLDPINIGDKVYIIEVVGTFKKTTEYNEGSVTQVSAVYDEPLPPGQFPMPNQPRKRIVDITIQCNGETKKFTIPENKSVITDSALGLTISTDKQEIINIVRNQYDTYKQRKEAIAKCDEEMAKCQALLDKLGINDKPAKENDEIIALQKEVNELKNIIRKANQMVPPPMKEMLPQDMKNAMDKVGQ